MSNSIRPKNSTFWMVREPKEFVKGIHGSGPRIIAEILELTINARAVQQRLVEAELYSKLRYIHRSARYNKFPYFTYSNAIIADFLAQR